MDINWDLVSRYAAPILALFGGAALDRLLENRPKLVTYLAHASAIKVPNPPGAPTQVHTHSVVVRNNGRKAATNLRLGHNTLPAFSVHPPHEYKELDVGDGKELVFPVLAPKEQITVAYLYFPPLLWNAINTYIRADEGSARALNVLPTPQVPPWFYRIGLFLLVVGGITTLVVVGQTVIRLAVLLYGH